MCFGVDVLVPRQRASIELKSEAIILGSRQGLSTLEPVASLDIGAGHVEVRDEIKILLYLSVVLSLASCKVVSILVHLVYRSCYTLLPFYLFIYPSNFLTTYLYT